MAGSSPPRGQCVKVPACSALRHPPQHCVKSFGVQEAYGLIWVQLEKPEGVDVPLPVFEAEGDERLRQSELRPLRRAGERAAHH